MDEALRQPRRELELAWDSAEAMRNTGDYDTIEGNWRRVLNHLEKVWVKTERCCQAFRGTFEPWQRQYRLLRQSDPLLSYLKHARDADNHSAQDVTYIIHGTIQSVPGRAPMLFWSGPEPVVAPVVSRGVTYEPPLTHLGHDLGTRDPRILSVHGCNFYAEYFTRAHNEFFASAP
jgi:hypothetical protein